MSARRDRFREIVETLSSQGLGFALGYLGLNRHFPFDGHAPFTRHPLRDRAALPERIRLTLERLGAVYIKFGQIMSTRSDILPPDYAAELGKLQDASPPVPAGDIRAVIADELTGAGNLLPGLEDAPLATGSIGQAHVAQLGGMEVVVKVRRPGVVEQVNLDLEIMEELAKRAEQASAAAAQYRVSDFVDEFSQTLRAELDYLQEAHNAEQFAANFASDSRVHIPKVFWEATTTRVLTLERISGIKINDVRALEEAGHDPRVLAGKAASVLLKMVFEDGFFHADPHPGNFFIEADGRLGVIDFGMVGRIPDTLKARLVKMLLAVVEQDAPRLTDALVQMCGTSSTRSAPGLEADIARLLDRYAGRPVAEIPVVPIITQVVGLLRQHHLRLPRETALLLKMLIMADGLGKQLDPGFEIMTELEPFARKVMLESFTPAAIAERLKQLGTDALRMGADAPALVRRAAELLERGGIDVHLRTSELEPIVARLERSGNRIVAGLLAAALINAIGELVAGQPAQWRNWPKALFSAGIGGVGALGGYLVWSSRRRP